MISIRLDRKTKCHNRRVKILMETFLHDHPYEFCYQQELITAACIHDIGKHYIPNEILNAPRRLTIEEREIIDWHAYYSYELAKEQGYSDRVCKMVLYHHGEDKPKKMKIEVSNEIRRHALLLQVVDAYDALTSKRTYHEKYSDEIAMRIIASSKEFDREIVTLFADWEARKEVISAFASRSLIRHVKNIVSHMTIVQKSFGTMQVPS